MPNETVDKMVFFDIQKKFFPSINIVKCKMIIIKENGFIKTTNQYWKYIGSILPLLILGLIFLYQQFISDYVTIFQGKLSILTLFSIILFIWGCFSIKCPKCKLRIIWYSISKLDYHSWGAWLVSFTNCPNCSYSPLKKR